jgi:polyisoprenoid-binding protein YceI
MGVACKLQSPRLALLLLALLVGCSGGVRKPESAPVVAPTTQVAREGEPYMVDAQGSLLTIRVYRGGTLAKAGHNHLVASHDLAGKVYLADDLTRASFELSLPIARLTVDDAELRAGEGPDFSAEVPQSAKDGTRRNMLGEALLDAERFPIITLRSTSMSVVAPGELLAAVQVAVKGGTYAVTVPIHHEKAEGALVATGELVLRHSEIGLAPFSVMLGVPAGG